MILLYRSVLLAVMYAAVVWLIVRFVFPRRYRQVAACYHGFERWIEQADTRPFFRWADLVSKVLFVVLASAFAGLLLAGVAAGFLNLHLAR